MNADGRGVPVVAGPLAGYEAAFRAVGLYVAVGSRPDAGDGWREPLA